jgi:hypothetical protein
MESGLLMLARAGVLACIFLPQYTTSHHLRCQSRAPVPCVHEQVP